MCYFPKAPSRVNAHNPTEESPVCYQNPGGLHRAPLWISGPQRVGAIAYCCAGVLWLACVVTSALFRFGAPCLFPVVREPAASIKSSFRNP
jgi:hypothetical protein